MRRLLTVLGVCFWGIPAFGQTHQLESAKALQTTCTTAMKVFDEKAAASTQDAVAYGKCLGYVEAVVDSMRSLNQTGKDGRNYNFHLHGDGLSVKDAIVCFLEFMKTDNEYDHDSSAAPMVIRSLMTNHLVTTSATMQQR